MTMKFYLESFVSLPLLEVINNLRKANLLVIAIPCELSVNKTMTKVQIEKLIAIVAYLQDEELCQTVVTQAKKKLKLK